MEHRNDQNHNLRRPARSWLVADLVPSFLFFRVPLITLMEEYRRRDLWVRDSRHLRKNMSTCIYAFPNSNHEFGFGRCFVEPELLADGVGPPFLVV